VRVLDLHAEFRCLTSGLDLAGDHDLAAAYAYFRVDGLPDLLKAMLPNVSLGHALLRGRYSAAVARMEATGTPIDVPVLAHLRAGDLAARPYKARRGHGGGLHRLRTTRVRHRGGTFGRPEHACGV